MEPGVQETLPSQQPFVLALALVLMSTPAWSQAATETARPEPILPFTEFTLDNGLTVLVREDHKLPIVSVEVVYQAGSRNDPPGKSGLAHLFEHLLFYGSEHHPHNFLVAMQRLGGTNVNGGTGPDLTTVYETVPISQLDAVLWLESDRMGYLLPALTQKTLDEQVELIRNEINMGRDEPGGDVRFHISAGVFPPDHPYHKEPVGDPKELGNITLDDARNFFRTYYAPSNAAVVIAGDITPSQAFEKVKLYFGGLPTGPRPGRITTWVPELSQDKRERVFDAAPPKLFLAWPMPSFGTIDDVHLRLAGSILMDGDSSRVRRRLSAAGLDASDLSWFAGANAMAGIFQISTGATSPTELRTIERLIRDEIAALAAKEPTREELERAQRSRILTLRRLAQRTADSNGQADLLANTWGLGDRDAGLLDANMQQMLAATPADVSAATRRWLDRAAHVLDLEPTAQYRRTSADVDRSRIPGPTAFKPAVFPRTPVATLPNGLKMRHARWEGGPVVVASLIVRGGAGVDPGDKPGLARLTASLLTAGAGTMSEDELAGAMARLDATLQATTDLDTITLTLIAPKEQMKEALGVLGTVVAAPTFPAAAVERERKKQIQELQNLPNEPRLLSRATVRRLVYGTGAPYAAQENGLGTTSGVSKITRADIADFHRRWFNPANSDVVIVGDIGQAEAEALLAGNLSRWSSAGSRATGRFGAGPDCCPGDLSDRSARDGAGRPHRRDAARRSRQPGEPRQRGDDENPRRLGGRPHQPGSARAEAMGVLGHRLCRGRPCRTDAVDPDPGPDPANGRIDRGDQGPSRGRERQHADFARRTAACEGHVDLVLAPGVGNRRRDRKRHRDFGPPGPAGRCDRKIRDRCSDGDDGAGRTGRTPGPSPRRHGVAGHRRPVEGGARAQEGRHRL